MSIQHLHEKLRRVKVYLPHQHKRELQRTLARKRAKSPHHGQEPSFRASSIDREDETHHEELLSSNCLSVIRSSSPVTGMHASTPPLPAKKSGTRVVPHLLNYNLECGLYKAAPIESKSVCLLAINIDPEVSISEIVRICLTRAFIARTVEI